MPKKTFFNLADEKKEKIIECSKREFAQYSFYDASINRIIKEAGIPRGSFYQYFENKEDLFVYILDGYSSLIIEEVLKKLESKKCDLFDLHLLIFDVVSSTDISEDNKKFFITTVSNMSFKLINHLSSFLFKKDCDKVFAEISQIVNCNNIKLNNAEDIINIQQILMNTLMYQLGIFFSNINDKEKCRKSLIRQFELIKYGIVQG